MPDVVNKAHLMGNNSVFSLNEIDHFGDDAIDYAGSNISITHNNIHDNLDLADGNHEDAMQGQNGSLPNRRRLAMALLFATAFVGHERLSLHFFARSLTSSSD
jgi:hypothetical protein